LKIADDVEFLGGCATGLLVADSAAPLYPVARLTGDIDLSPRGFMRIWRQRPMATSPGLAICTVWRKKMRSF
jgi:hypothetical protein